ncbi:MAG: hypothetical protein HUU55_12825 [Myxococcales bacterium]|nr:hypothetical protein [Myxococcales bacterium]
MEFGTTEQIEEHLKRVERLLTDLLHEVEGIRTAVTRRSTPRTTTTAAPTTHQDPPGISSRESSAAELLLVEAELVDETKTLWEPELVDDEVAVDPPEDLVSSTTESSLALTSLQDDAGVSDDWMTTAADVLKVLFIAAADPDEEEGFRRFCHTIHSDHSQGPRALAELRAFHWRQLRKRYGQYLHDATQPDSFSISHTVPTVVSPKDHTMKVFVSSSTRSPVPTVFRRDLRHSGHWRIEVTSL